MENEQSFEAISENAVVLWYAFLLRKIVAENILQKFQKSYFIA